MSDLNLDGLSDKQLQLFAVRCARRVQYLMTNPRSIAALDVAERYARGEATDKELAEAAEVTRLAAWVAASAAAWVAALEAARAAELAEQQKILDEIRKEQPQ